MIAPIVLGAGVAVVALVVLSVVRTRRRRRHIAADYQRELASCLANAEMIAHETTVLSPEWRAQASETAAVAAAEETSPAAADPDEAVDPGATAVRRFGSRPEPKVVISGT